MSVTVEKFDILTDNYFQGGCRVWAESDLGTSICLSDGIYTAGNKYTHRGKDLYSLQVFSVQKMQVYNIGNASIYFKKCRCIVYEMQIYIVKMQIYTE